MSFLGSQFGPSAMGGYSGSMGHMGSMYGGGFAGGMMNNQDGPMQNGQMQGAAQNEY